MSVCKKDIQLRRETKYYKVMGRQCRKLQKKKKIREHRNIGKIRIRSKILSKIITKIDTRNVKRATRKKNVLTSKKIIQGVGDARINKDVRCKIL